MLFLYCAVLLSNRLDEVIDMHPFEHILMSLVTWLTSLQGAGANTSLRVVSTTRSDIKGATLDSRSRLKVERHLTMVAESWMEADEGIHANRLKHADTPGGKNKLKNKDSMSRCLVLFYSLMKFSVQVQLFLSMYSHTVTSFCIFPIFPPLPSLYSQRSFHCKHC